MMVPQADTPGLLSEILLLLGSLYKGIDKTNG